MLILKHNVLSADDLFLVERHLLRWLDDKGPRIDQDFNVLLLDRNTIYGHLLGIFVHLGACEALSLDESQLLDFLIDVDGAYLHAPYHSFSHAVDIVSVLYYMLVDLKAACYLSALDMTTLLLAALCHDVGHPGYNNLYQVNFKTDLARRYHNTSVLECLSVDLTHDLFHKHKLQHVSMPMITELILSTDMVSHYDLQDQARSLQDAIAGRGPVSLVPAQRQSLCSVLLHAADISNTVRPWPICKQWSDLIVQEFFRQGDAEREKQQPISPGMDRSQSTQPDISLKFGDFVVKPYFEALAGFLPAAHVFLTTLGQNRHEWMLLRENPSPTTPALFPPEPLDEAAPDSPLEMMNTTIGRRVSVAAGVIVIPDQPPTTWRNHQKKRSSVVGLQSSQDLVRLVGGGTKPVVVKRAMSDTNATARTSRTNDGDDTDGHREAMPRADTKNGNAKFIIFGVVFPCIVCVLLPGVLPSVRQHLTFLLSCIVL